jgi:peptidoglycan/LPS O-acetylase OafA/YrhL
VKRYFYTLDVMRGVAAIGVVCFHLSRLIAPFGVPHGYLAVDFFFALSGLVISRAYTERLRDGLGLGQFLYLRVERLYPLYFLGTLAGVAAALLPHALHPSIPLPGRGMVVSGVSALFMLPSPAPVGERLWLTPFDIAAWSLILELAINIVFAACWRWLTGPVLIGILAISGASLVALVLGHGNIDVGATWPTLPSGLVRTAFSFFVGVALGRLDNQIGRSTSFALALPLMLFLTLLPGPGWGAAYDLACSLAIYPALLFLGARYEAPQAVRLRFLGEVSYPVYVIHGPILMLVSGLVMKYAARTEEMRLGSAALLLAGVIAIAAAAEAGFDRPVRGWLARRRKLRASRSCFVASLPKGHS